MGAGDCFLVEQRAWLPPLKLGLSKTDALCEFFGGSNLQYSYGFFSSLKSKKILKYNLTHVALKFAYG